VVPVISYPPVVHSGLKVHAATGDRILQQDGTG